MWRGPIHRRLPASTLTDDVNIACLRVDHHGLGVVSLVRITELELIDVLEGHGNGGPTRRDDGFPHAIHVNVAAISAVVTDIPHVDVACSRLWPGADRDVFPIICLRPFKAVRRESMPICGVDRENLRFSARIVVRIKDIRVDATGRDSAGFDDYR